MRRFRHVVVYLTLAALASARASGQSGQPRNEFEITTGYSPASSTVIGTVEDRKFVMAGFTYAHRCWDEKNVAISYAAGVMPAAIVVQPRQSGVNRASHSVYGFAVTPVGFVFEFAARRRVHPLVETSGGIIASTEPIPTNTVNATGLNFLFYFGGGLRVQLHERGAVSLGYRFLHISNAGTTNFNPGLDNNVFYVGYSFHLRGGRKTAATSPPHVARMASVQ
jgi:hypothetical protein